MQGSIGWPEEATDVSSEADDCQMGLESLSPASNVYSRNFVDHANDPPVDLEMDRLVFLGAILIFCHQHLYILIHSDYWDYSASYLKTSHSD